MTNFLLNRGGAGKSITRQETGDHLSLVMQRLIHIIAGYDTLAGLVSTPEQQTSIEERQHMNRSELAKVSELILSTGAVPPRTPAADALPLSADTAAAALEALMESERDFKTVLKDQLKLSHQFRNRALLEDLARNADLRIDLIKNLSAESGVMAS